MKKKLGMVCALYLEAKPLIHRFSLQEKKAPKNVRFFENEEMALVVSGVGKLSSAISTTFLFCSRNCFRALNIGMCGSCKKEYSIGDTFLIDKIYDSYEKREYFLDILQEMTLPRATLQTVFSPATGTREIQEDLVDMEASGFYASARNFFDASDIFIIKIVSDFLAPKKVLKQDIERHMENNFSHVDAIKNLPLDFPVPFFTDEEKFFIHGLFEKYRFTVTQKYQLMEGLRKINIQTETSFLKNFDFEKQVSFKNLSAKEKGKEILGAMNDFLKKTSEKKYFGNL